MPLGRGVTYEAAIEAAELLAELITEPPAPLIDQNDDCHAIYDLWRNTAYQNYQDDMDGCGLIGGAIDGGGLLATVGAGIGGIFGNLPGAGIGAVIGAIVGGTGGAINGVAGCVADAKRDYRKQYRKDWACLQECLATGDWDCGF